MGQTASWGWAPPAPAAAAARPPPPPKAPTAQQLAAAEAKKKQEAAAAAAAAEAKKKKDAADEVIRQRVAAAQAVAAAQQKKIAAGMAKRDAALAALAARAGFADYGEEPEWTESISNSTICTWFYTFYLANLIVFFLVIAAASYIFIYGKRHFTVSNLFFALLQLIVSGTNMLFFYLMCDRSLKP